MANWYYYNEDGEKIEVTSKELKQLALQGVITPETRIETEEGKTAPARKVKGLTFAETKQPEAMKPIEAETYGVTTTHVESLSPNVVASTPLETVALSKQERKHKNRSKRLEYEKQLEESVGNIARKDYNSKPTASDTKLLGWGCLFWILFPPLGALLHLIMLFQIWKKVPPHDDHTTHTPISPPSQTSLLSRLQPMLKKPAVLVTIGAVFVISIIGIAVNPPWSEENQRQYHEKKQQEQRLVEQRRQQERERESERRERRAWELIEEREQQEREKQRQRGQDFIDRMKRDLSR